MKKVFTKILVSTIIALLISGCSNQKPDTKPLGHARLINPFDNLEAITKESSLIVEVQVKKEPKFKGYSGVTSTITPVYVENVLAGDMDFVGKEINFLQWYLIDDAPVKKGEHLVLFLYKYEGPVAKDAYCSRGLGQGQYTVGKDKKLSPRFDTGDPIMKEISGYNLDELKEKVK